MEQTMNTEIPEAKLLREWRKQADPVRELRSQVQAALAATHYEQQKTFFDSLEQRRIEHAAELAKSHPDMTQEHKDSLMALDIAKRAEHLQKQQAAERKTALSGLPEVPSYLNVLEQRAEQDVEAAKLVEIERNRSGQEMSIKGQRVAQLDPMVLEGLTYEINPGDNVQAIHYARDGERVMTDRGDRLDVYRLDDREIEAALRLAEQKYDMQRGLMLTGSREFQERAAEIAGRLNLKIQNEELQSGWQKGNTMVNDTGAGTTPVPPAGGIEQTREAVLAVQSAEQAIDHKYLGAEYVLARLDMSAREALQAASAGKPLTGQQREMLSGGDVHPSLIDEQGRLNEDGVNAYERMNAGMEEDRQLQQQLRTRNIDEALEAKEVQVDARAEQAREDGSRADSQRKPEARKQGLDQQGQGVGM